MRHLWFLTSVGAIALSLNGCTSDKPATSANSTIADTGDTTLLEADAKESISSMLFDEKTRFLEKKSFSTANPGLKTSAIPENKSYAYKITPIAEKGSGISITATSKQPGFRSFTGVVFALESRSGPLTVSQICETVKPSQLAPVAPAMPTRPSEKIRCPAGSRSYLEIASAP